MTFRTKRIYEESDPGDGIRILVDRLWPRGMSREKARLDLWMKEVAPSSELRKVFGHAPDKWEDFRSRYFAELETNAEAVESLLEMGRQKEVTLLFAHRNKERNNAVALKEYLELREKRRASR